MMRIRYVTYFVLYITVITLLITADIIYASSQSSTNYIIENAVISSSSGHNASDNYSVEHTTGQHSTIGESSSDNYSNFNGFLYTVNADSDGDGILDDGDGSGIIGDNLCAGLDDPYYPDCDDNCAYMANPDQSDIDDDGVGNICDNCRETFNPDQIDDNSSEDDNTSIAGDQHYGDVCDPDFDNDGDVGIRDFNEWRKYVGQDVPPAPAYIDLNNDGTIWIQDFNIWRLYYGGPPGPGIGD